MDLHDTETVFNSYIKTNSIMIFSKNNCKYCTQSYEYLDNLHQKYYTLVLENTDHDIKIKKYIIENTDHKTFPFIYINGKFIGGYTELLQYPFLINDF